MMSSIVQHQEGCFTWHWLAVLSFVLFMSCDNNTEQPEPEPSGEGTETEQTETDEQLTQTGETPPSNEETTDGTGAQTEPIGNPLEQSENVTAVNEIEVMTQFVQLFHLTHRRLPANLEELDQTIDGIDPITDSVPLDVWGTAYRYELSGNAFYLTSAGPDTLFDTDDDIRSVLAID